MLFFRFPSLVQREILGNLRLEDLVILSLCSKRTNSLIQAIEKYRLRKIKAIKYSFFDYDSIDAVSDTTETCISLGGDPWQNLDLTPMKVFLRNNFSKRCFFDKVRRTFIIEGIHNCFLNLFGSSVTYEIRSFDRQLPPSLKNIKNSFVGSLAGTDAEKLEACFKNSPNQEYIILDGLGPLKLCQNSVINRTEYLDIYSRGTCGDDILMSFKGKSLNLIFVYFQQSTITKFLNNWKSNQGFQNLKFLCIHHSVNENLDIAKIMEDTGVRWLIDDTVLKWRERNMPEVLNGQNEWKERSLVTRKYLDRDSDGERAFIRISSIEFSFVVGSSAKITNGMRRFNWL